MGTPTKPSDCQSESTQLVGPLDSGRNMPGLYDERKLDLRVRDGSVG